MFGSFKLTFCLAAAFVGTMVASAPSSAAVAPPSSPRTWVSGTGNDGNDCGRTTPCLTFVGAYAKTVAGGEIDCLDPGGFGSLAIDHAITIDCGGGIQGQVGSVLVGMGNGIYVNAGVSDRVVLRNMSIIGGSNCNASYGISFGSGASLILQHVSISGFGGAGLLYAPSTTTTQLGVYDSDVNNNCGDGIRVAPLAGGSANATLANVRADTNTTDGLLVDTTSLASGSGATVTVANSVFVHSANAIQDHSTFNSSVPTNIILMDSMALNSTYGILANGAGTTVRMDNVRVTGNTNGIAMANGGKIFSFGNSNINGNTTSDGAPLPPTLVKQ